MKSEFNKNELQKSTHHSKEPSQRLLVLNKLENTQIACILDNCLTQPQKTHA